MPENVVRVMGFFIEPLAFMSIENRPPEGDMFRAVSVATQSHVATGQHKLKLAASGFAEDSDRLALAEPAYIIPELLVKAIVPIGVRHAFKDSPDEGLLVSGIEAAGHGGIRNAPVVLDPGAQETPFRIGMIPAEAYGPALFLAQGIMEYLDEGFGW